jgi:carbonic anhydrase
MNYKTEKMKAHTKETQASMTPEKALQYLKEGNKRFQNNLSANRNLLQQVNETTDGQFPFATILSCIDSRVSAELVFDQGLGDIFSIRIAGNFVNEDILGSMEFASKLAGTKLVVVLGHTSCGAIKGACDHARMGNLTKLIQKIEPAVEAVIEPKDESLRNSNNLEFVDTVAAKNVKLTIDKIRSESPILAEMEQKGEIMIVGAMYDISDGSVAFDV